MTRSAAATGTVSGRASVSFCVADRRVIGLLHVIDDDDTAVIRVPFQSESPRHQSESPAFGDAADPATGTAAVSPAMVTTPLLAVQASDATMGALN